MSIRILLLSGALILFAPVSAMSSWWSRPFLPATCESMMRAVSPEMRTQKDTLPTLYKLLNQITAETGLVTNDAWPNYQSYRFRGESLTGARRRSVQTMQGRVVALIDDLKSSDLDATVVAYEIRGNQNILNTLTRVQSELEALQTEVWRELRRRFPLVRPQTLLDALMMYIGYDMVSNAIIAPNFETIFKATFLGLSAAGYAVSRIARDLTSRDREFEAHLQLIRDRLSSTRINSGYSAYGQHHFFPTEQHQSLMQCSGSASPGNNALVEACQNDFIFFVDLIEEILRVHHQHGSLSSYRMQRDVEFPSGSSRAVYLDHLFFIDQSTGEPVWIFSYRAYREQRSAPRRPRETRESSQQSSWDWIPGLRPAGAGR